MSTKAPDPRWDKALHEAGHAVVAYLLDIPFEQVSIVTNGKSHGHVVGNYADVANDIDDAELTRRVALIMLAGCVAQVLLQADKVEEDQLGELLDELQSTVGASDYEAAADIAGLKLDGDEAEREYADQYVNDRLLEVIDLFNQRYVLLACEALARRLMRRGTIRWREGSRTIRRALSFDDVDANEEQGK